MIEGGSPGRRPAVLVFVALISVYSATLAPGVTFWDSGEFLAAIHSLGIPHPPGTPLFVIVANVWARLFTPLLGFARAVNLLSAVCAALGCALLADLITRWTRDGYAGFGAGICAGATSTLWMSATETEVYAPAFLVACLLLWIAARISEGGERHWWILLAYVAGLGWSLHLTALIVLPSALVLAMGGRDFRGDVKRITRMLPFLVAIAVLGASVVSFMYIRAQHDPAVNQGNPATLASLSDVITRRQYGTFHLWPRQAPFFIQLGNIFEWADWQFALGMHSEPPPGWVRTPFTLVFAGLGILGSLHHRTAHRLSWRALLTLLLTASVGVVIYLNLKAGPSYGGGFMAQNALREARERDYFFILAWVCWGLWAGLGAHVLAARTFKLASSRAHAGGLALAALPLLLNWRAVDRGKEPRASEARDFAAGVLRGAPISAIILARGDNDTYPIWYMREVERARADLVPITVPMLPAQWYRAELMRRYSLLSENFVARWEGTDATIRAICAAAKVQGRSVSAPVVKGDFSFRPGCSGR